MTDEKCPRCKEGIIQRTALTPPDKGEAIGCNRCPYPLGEPGLFYDPLEVDEGWEPPYRNKNACFEQKLAKEIGELSDEAVEVAVKKYFVKNPCNEIEIGIMDRHNNDYEKRLLLNAIEENAFLKQERERLIKKLEKIDNLSRYAWAQVTKNPQEAEELFRMINLESK